MYGIVLYHEFSTVMATDIVNFDSRSWGVALDYEHFLLPLKVIKKCYHAENLYLVSNLMHFLHNKWNWSPTF